MSTYLSATVASHRAAAADDHRDVATLIDRARAMPPAVPFAAALAPSPEGGIGVIAEVKRRSPSKGDLAPDLDPAALATRYRQGGARCLSVLTDIEYFGGSVADLQAAKQATGLPVLRKDFTVAPADVCDARLMGADAVLLIVAALDPEELAALAALARDVGLDALVEVHDERELDRALAVGASLVGVNQRDLVTFAVDSGRAERLAASIPRGVVAVAESGVRGPEDAARLAAAGFDAVLVGESLVRSDNPQVGVAALTGHPIGPRSALAPIRGATPMRAGGATPMRAGGAT
jgi:indole-3-glycerol phosphate synthase